MLLSLRRGSNSMISASICLVEASVLLSAYLKCKDSVGVILYEYGMYSNPEP